MLFAIDALPEWALSGVVNWRRWEALWRVRHDWLVPRRGQAEAAFPRIDACFDFLLCLPTPQTRDELLAMSLRVEPRHVSDSAELAP